jgi:hypothetical protein
MDDPLATYLADHLAGSAYAIDLVKAMRHQHSDNPLGQFAADLLVDIEADRDVLQKLAERVGSGSSGLKELTAWLAEKVSRLKLRHEDDSGLGTFEALEFLGLGIHGKSAMWRALAAAAPGDPRLRGTDYDRLIARAEAQHARVEEHRLEAARTTLRSAKTS